MASAAKRKGSVASGDAPLSIEQHLWTIADNLRGHMDAAEYKPSVSGARARVS